MIRSLFLFIVALMLWPAVSYAETPDEYRAVLSETVRAAEAAHAALPPDSSLVEYPPLRPALQQLESIDHITTDSGTEVAVDNRLIVQQLRGSRLEGHQAYENLRQLLIALDAASGREAWTEDGNFRESLDEVLARPEFHASTGNPISQFVDDLRARLFRWLAEHTLNAKIPQLPDFDFVRPITVIFWLVAGALIIFATVFFIFTLRYTRRNMARFAALQVGREIEREDARSARLAAQQAADSGDYRLGIHYLYLWAVLRMAEESRLRYDRSLTNREQLRTLGRSGEVTELLRAAIDSFDRIWYGHAACTAADYGQFRSTVEQVVGAIT